MNERIKEDYTKYYDIIKLIGTGAYGCVHKGKEIKTNELRAIKVIDLGKIEDNLLSQYKPDELKEHLKLFIDIFIKEFENMKICSNNMKTR